MFMLAGTRNGIKMSINMGLEEAELWQACCHERLESGRVIMPSSNAGSYE